MREARVAREGRRRSGPLTPWRRPQGAFACCGFQLFTLGTWKSNVLIHLKTAVLNRHQLPEVTLMGEGGSVRRRGVLHASGSAAGAARVCAGRGQAGAGSGVAGEQPRTATAPGRARSSPSVPASAGGALCGRGPARHLHAVPIAEKR